MTEVVRIAEVLGGEQPVDADDQAVGVIPGQQGRAHAGATEGVQHQRLLSDVYGRTQGLEGLQELVRIRGRPVLPGAGRHELAWEVPISNVDGGGQGPIGRYYVDARTGAVLRKRSTMLGVAKSVTSYKVTVARQFSSRPMAIRWLSP